MKPKKLEKLFKDKLFRDGMNKKWLDERLILDGLDDEDIKDD